MSDVNTLQLADVTVKVGSGSTPRGGEAAYKTTGTPLIRSMNVHFDGFRDGGLAHIDDEQADALRNVEVRARDVLLNITGASIGRVTLAPSHMDGARVNQHVCIIRPNTQLESSFLRWFLASPRQQRLINSMESGATRQALTKEKILGFKVPLPTLDEQRATVAEIEKQFTRLDEAVANLQRVKAHLKRYKASVLKAAVEGRLVETEASISQRTGRSYETAADLIGRTPVPPRPNRYGSRTGGLLLGHSALAVGMPPVPLREGWKWVSLVDIARMESGHTPSRSHPEWWGGDVPWIGIPDARDHHEGAIRRTIQYTNADGIENSAARVLPAGTVCVSRTASVGYVVVMAESMATSQDFVNWVPTSAVISDWLRVVFTADRDALVRFGKGSVHKTIYFPEWLSMAIALPPLAEQRRIVSEVDRRLSILGEVEAEVDANLKRAGALRRATLAKAFAP